MDTRDSSSFGDILKAFRQQKHVNQRELSMKLGVHYNTVSKWERGMCLPDSKGMVLELAKKLCLAEHETRILLEASLTALSPYWYVPYPCNPFFTGREKILEALHKYLGVDQKDAATAFYALRGLGGIGKTQIALQYAYRYALEYRAVFWLRAETVESIISGMLDIAEVLQLPTQGSRDQEQVIAAVLRWLSSHSQWLLIWDNLEDLQLLQRFLPTTRQSAILLTTRQQALGVFARGINLLPMEQEEGMLFLLRRAKLLEPEIATWQMQQFATSQPVEYAATAELITALGGLPLALDQAGAYIEETGCSLMAYLQRYKEQRMHLLDRRGLQGKDHPHSVATTFRLASEQMEQDRAAAALLKVCAFLHADAIPEELFIAGAIHLGPDLAALEDEPVQFDQAIVVLRGLSLVSRQAKNSTLSLHRLMQTVLREQMSDQEQMLWLKRTIKALNSIFPEVIYEVWEQCERLLPHALAVAAFLPDEKGDQAMVEMLRKTADYLRVRFQYQQAELLYRRALHIGEQVLGPIHREKAFLFNGLGLLYAEQGQYERAEPFYQQAVHIGELAQGSAHRDVAQLLNGLAMLYWRQGKYEQAGRLYERALYIRERNVGPEHPETTALLNGLAFLYMEQGKDEQARRLYQRVLSIWKRTHEANDPALVYPLDRQVEDGSRQGQIEQNVSVWEQIGSQYPFVAYPLYGLAVLSAREGQDDQAALFYRCALRIKEAAVGPEHYELAYPLVGLAELYLKHGKDEQAESLYWQALRIQEQQLGLHHPEVAQTSYGLALFYRLQGKMSEALSFAERALKIFSHSLRDTHPKTVAARGLYTRLMQEQEDSERREAG